MRYRRRYAYIKHVMQVLLWFYTFIHHCNRTNYSRPTVKCQLECSSLHFYVFINPVWWIWTQVLIHIIMDVFIS